MQDKKLEEILARRDQCEFGSAEWDEINEEKADYLESIKPSTKEHIIYFDEDKLAGIDSVFTKNTQVFDLPFGIERRSLLEYHPTKRHPIPYVLIRFGDKYFFTLREQGGGELRLIGKKGLIGGHVGEEDVVEGDLERTLYKALLREVEEEAGIKFDIIKSAVLKGIIKSDLGVDFDHLGFVYEIEISTDQIKSEEDGVLTGIWISKDEFTEQYDSFENWLKIVYDNLLK